MADNDRVTATYFIETAFPLEQAAATMAGEQSTGTFVRVPGETDALREAHAARVEELVELGDVATPSLPGSGLPKSGGDGRRRAARVTLSWPMSNFGPSLPNLLAAIAGNLSELKAFSGLKLVDIKLPPAFLERYQGPQFGVAGTRALAGVHDRPIIGTIIKPKLGLRPELFADACYRFWLGGDFVKNDEPQGNQVFAPYREILRRVPTFPALGNHEGHSADSATQTGPYYTAYVTPTAGELGTDAADALAAAICHAHFRQTQSRLEAAVR